MPKLLTPTQYESALDGLNDVRPLSLTDEVKNALELPVLNVNPVDKDKSVVGKLARCNEQGALLKDSGIWANDFQDFMFLIFPHDESIKTASFAQVVKAVILEITGLIMANELWWCAENGDKFIAYRLDGTYFIPFYGDIFRIHKLYKQATLTVKIYGFF